MTVGAFVGDGGATVPVPVSVKVPEYGPYACPESVNEKSPHWRQPPPAPGSYTNPSVLPEASNVFFVGKNYSATQSRSGELWLGFNDDAYSANIGDNSGQINATVSIFPTREDQCKDDGWMAYGIFKNQGDCVSYVATHGKNPPSGQ